MSTDIIFNKDFDEKTVYVSKIYDAEVKKVWDYFTKAEFLDLWWAPKPWKCDTKNQNFSKGGIWHYSIVDTDGQRHYSQMKYGEITENRSFDGLACFCDEKGNLNSDFNESKWLFGFTGVKEGTKMTINIHFHSEDDMKKQIEMGFEEGFKTGLNQLEEILSI